MAYRVKVEGVANEVRRGAPILQLTSRTRRQRVLNELAQQSVVALKSERSLWPVDSGKSKAGFYARGSTIHNRERYAAIIERRGGRKVGPRPAERTVNREFPRIVERANRNLPLISRVRRSRDVASAVAATVPAATAAARRGVAARRARRAARRG